MRRLALGPAVLGLGSGIECHAAVLDGFDAYPDWHLPLPELLEFNALVFPDNSRSTLTTGTGGSTLRALGSIELLGHLSIVGNLTLEAARIRIGGHLYIDPGSNLRLAASGDWPTWQGDPAGAVILGTPGASLSTFTPDVFSYRLITIEADAPLPVGGLPPVLTLNHEHLVIGGASSVREVHLQALESGPMIELLVVPLPGALPLLAGALATGGILAGWRRG